MPKEAQMTGTLPEPPWDCYRAWYDSHRVNTQTRAYQWNVLLKHLCETCT